MFFGLHSMGEDSELETAVTLPQMASSESTLQFDKTSHGDEPWLSYCQQGCKVAKQICLTSRTK